MSDTAIDDALTAAAGDVLETMFFSPVVGEAPAEACHGEPALTARVKFSGGRSGWFAVRVTMTAAGSIAGNFLGEESDAPEPSQVRDVICELANMICGNVLSRLDRETHFDLQHPELVEACSQPPEGSVCRFFELQDGHVGLCLQLDPAL